jgi:hypothetical protein
MPDVAYRILRKLRYWREVAWQELDSYIARSGAFVSGYHKSLLGLSNTHSGQTALLVGNGPSVRVSDLEQLRPLVSFCCNRFHLAYNRMTFRPSYTIATDEQTISDFGKEIAEESKGVVLLSQLARPTISAPFVYIRQRTHRVGFSQSPLIAPYACGASLILACQIGYWMGIKKFFLYGVDHHYPNLQSTGSKDVYYSAEGEGNHFIADYRSGRPWCPPSTRHIESGWACADSFLRSRGGFVKNATRGGKLEVLERVSTDDLFKG